MKKFILALGLPLFVMFFLILIMITSMMTSMDTTVSRNSAFNDNEEPLNLEFEGNITKETMDSIGVIPRADASKSYIEVKGGYNSGKITNKHNVWWLRGSGNLVSVGDGGDGSTSGTTGIGAQGAIDWAVNIANDNSFCYGDGGRAHNAGCYFCATNITGKKHATKGSRWEKTYCCNPFVFAAYAHGANDPAILKACKKGRCGGMNPKDWTQYGCFEHVGPGRSVAPSQLKPGDVIMCDDQRGGRVNHVWMYIGDDKGVEASGGGWSKKSIHVFKGALKEYNNGYRGKACDVVRYTGGGTGGTTLFVSGSGANGALQWAKQIADDNSYTYALTNTCYVCDGVGGKTYCCASFVRSAYAHGAGDKDMQEACRRHDCGSVGSLKTRMLSSGAFKNLGAIKQSQMQPGDVIFWGGHVEMYWGHGKKIGAHNSGLSKNKQISVNGMYGGYNAVLRYKGGGSGIGASLNQTYKKSTVIRKIGKKDLEKVVDCPGPGGYPTAQSMAYMGNGKVAVCVTDVSSSNKRGTYGYIKTFQNKKV